MRLGKIFSKASESKEEESLDAMRSMAEADRLIHCLRAVESSNQLPIEHFRELAQTLYRLAGRDFHRAAYLGITQINHGQDAIVRNLLETVIGDQPFCVIDVGANDGWFVDRIVNYPSVQSIVAFEPIPTLREELDRRAANYPHIKIVPHAVGAARGQLKLNVYNRVNGLSSLLDVADDYHFLGSWFDQNDRQQVDVEVITLDDYFETNPLPSHVPSVALKIDVQGYEAQVLAGANRLLRSGSVKAILIELMTREKYRSSVTFLPILNELSKLGFQVYDLNPFYRERDMVFQECHTGRLTEMDCLLVHNDYL